ncbi:hypothetical protein [Actinomadura rupiterrae]|uniref:hypothetical protein n=1 Tax=Actinomadura rupiterrae TaxID=559627 RepID=UPI0020A32F42|nr:hypothetical protein [Actinomadura rupiterrae]
MHEAEPDFGPADQQERSDRAEGGTFVGGLGDRAGDVESERRRAEEDQEGAGRSQLSRMHAAHDQAADAGEQADGQS